MLEGSCRDAELLRMYEKYEARQVQLQQTMCCSNVASPQRVPLTVVAMLSCTASYANFLGTGKRKKTQQQPPTASVSLPQNEVARVLEVFRVAVQLASAPWPRGEVCQDLKLVRYPPGRALSVGAQQVVGEVPVGAAEVDELRPVHLFSRTARGMGTQEKNCFTSSVPKQFHSTTHSIGAPFRFR